MDDDLVVDQARVLLADVPVPPSRSACMGSVENIAAIAEIISDYPDIPVVFDPVLSSGRGDELADEEMVIALQELLLPLTTVLTPNSLEARRLAQFDEDDDEEDDEDDRRALRSTNARACSSAPAAVRAAHRNARIHGSRQQRAVWPGRP
jgi:hydroxymethylpyrimidine/phosphomethylpyrimidine kinase